MKIAQAENLPEVIIIEPDVYGDSRGRFLETYKAQRYLDLGVPDRFVQDNGRKAGKAGKLGSWEAGLKETI